MGNACTTSVEPNSFVEHRAVGVDGGVPVVVLAEAADKGAGPTPCGAAADDGAPEAPEVAVSDEGRSASEDGQELADGPSEAPADRDDGISDFARGSAPETRPRRLKQV